MARRSNACGVIVRRQAACKTTAQPTQPSFNGVKRDKNFWFLMMQLIPMCNITFMTLLQPTHIRSLLFHWIWADLLTYLCIRCLFSFQSLLQMVTSPLNTSNEYFQRYFLWWGLLYQNSLVHHRTHRYQVDPKESLLDPKVQRRIESANPPRGYSKYLAQSIMQKELSIGSYPQEPGRNVRMPMVYVHLADRLYLRKYHEDLLKQKKGCWVQELSITKNDPSRIE